MEVVKLGETEREVLTYLFNHKDSSAQDIAEGLKKPHTSYVVKPINSLDTKKYVEVTDKRSPEGRGRPAPLYSLSKAGAHLAVLIADGSLRNGLTLYKDTDREMMDTYKMYMALDEGGFQDKENFIRELMRIILSVAEHVTNDYDLVEDMCGVFVNRTLMKLPIRQRDRVIKSVNKWYPPEEKKQARKVAKKRHRQFIKNKV